jgi:Ankyrin repeat
MILYASLYFLCFLSFNPLLSPASYIIVRMLHFAAQRGHHNVISFLLDKGANISIYQREEKGEMSEMEMRNVERGGEVEMRREVR